MQSNCVGGELPTFPDQRWDEEKSNITKKIKSSVKAKVTKDSMEKQHVHLQTLLKQEQAVKILHQQQQDPTWRGSTFTIIRLDNEVYFK